MVNGAVRGLVAGAVEADDEAIADQLVGAHACTVATSLMRTACGGAGHHSAAGASSTDERTTSAMQRAFVAIAAARRDVVACVSPFCAVKSADTFKKKRASQPIRLRLGLLRRGRAARCARWRSAPRRPLLPGLDRARIDLPGKAQHVDVVR